MPQESFLFLRLIALALFLGVLLAGGWMLKNFDRLFGPDANVPSENSSARAYSKVQAFGLWFHALALTGAFALLMH